MKRTNATDAARIELLLAELRPVPDARAGADGNVAALKG